MNEFTPDQIIEYHRKSRQDDPSQTVEEVLIKHKRIADEWVLNNLSGPIPDGNIYMERVSGETISDRVEFQKVLKRIESDSIKAVFVIEPERLSRGDLADCGTIINAFRYTKTKIITPHHVFDLSQEIERMYLENELKRGNQYLEYTKLLMKRGREDAVKRGCYIATDPPFGYDIVKFGKDRTLKPNDEQKIIVKEIFEMFVSGMTIDSITRVLNSRNIKTNKGNMFVSRNINRMLKNHVYIGKIRWNARRSEKSMVDGIIVTKIVNVPKEDVLLVDGKHEAIISDEMFYKAQELFGTHAHCTYSKELKNPLSGLVKCGLCGKSMRYIKYNNREPRYACSTKRYSDNHCSGGTIACSCVYSDVKRVLKDSINDFELIIESGNNSAEIAKYEAEKAYLENQIKKLNDREMKVWEDRYATDSYMPDHIFKNITQNISDERDKLMEYLKKLKKPEEKDYQKIISSFHQVIETIDNEDIPAEERNKLIKKCIKSIKISKEKNMNRVRNTPYDIEIDLIF